MTHIHDPGPVWYPRLPRRWSELRDPPIVTPDQLHGWIKEFLGIRLARDHVCHDHVAPFEAFRSLFFDEPPVSLVLGSRGSGKSLMSAILTHLRCRERAGYSARIMGGSEQQSRQIYDALRTHVLEYNGGLSHDRRSIKELFKREVYYHNGSSAAILPASMKSARGPHVPGLFLDEIDEIKRDIFDSAVGMAQENTSKGHKTQIVMTSTWHHENGLMGNQIAAARERRFPLHEFCVFEVLERCPDERSGPHLENCPACPIVRWCHEDIDTNPEGRPKAKRSAGHYSIESFVQKAILLGEGVIEADYLCRGPRHEGVWFRTFSAANLATDNELRRGIAEFNPSYPVHVPIDYGVSTAALAFQVRPRITPHGPIEEVHIFGEYYAEGVPARENAIAIRAAIEPLLRGRRLEDCRVTMDPAGGRRDPIGPTGIQEYRRGGIQRIEWWPNLTGRKRESLRLVEAFIKSDTQHLFIHPRCKLLAAAFRGYARKRVGDHWLDTPLDPNHPHEDLIDSLAGGLLALYPNGRPERKAAGPRTHIAGVI